MSTEPSSNDISPANKWRFSRVGGFDQVSLQSGNDLLNLDQLDPKLWAALSCPTHGLEIDARTLELIDYDGDGRIRVPELLEAVKWATSLLKNPEDLLKGEDSLPLSSLDDSTPAGKELLSSARQILTNLGKPESTTISLEDTGDTVKIFAKTRFNGDGIITRDSSEEEAVKAVIGNVLECIEPETDRSGSPGVSREKVDLFFAETQKFADWWKKGEEDPHSDALRLFYSDGGAVAAFQAVRAKIDDFFLRCRLAQFDPSAAEALNPSVEDYRLLTSKELSRSSESLGSLPLAHIRTGASLPLTEGLNPAWTARIESFRSRVAAPLLGEKTSLTDTDWEVLSEKFRAYESWVGSEEGTTVEKLGIDRIREILSGGYREAILSLIEQDEALEPEANAIQSVDKLLRYYRDLFRLLNNFVCFHDFYTPGRKAIFQAGSLYMDGRSCDLCVRVTDVAKHSTLATLSHTYLAYCECTRNGEKMQIAAALTQGDGENLRPGRNGVFFDRQGRDWDATIVKIVEHPISIQQAFWSPYRRLARMVAEQAEKFASAREKQVQASAAGAIEAGKKPEAPKPGAEQPFDVAKFAGIFAAIGLAVGAIGTAIASVITGFLGLKWWQMPLAVVGIILMISGPSMILAYLNLRKRNLAPILDANGWAVNTKAMINIPFGSTLTNLAKLPEGAQRTLLDPFAEKERPWKLYLWIAALVAGILVLLQSGYLGQWLRLLF